MVMSKEKRREERGLLHLPPPARLMYLSLAHLAPLDLSSLILVIGKRIHLALAMRVNGSWFEPEKSYIFAQTLLLSSKFLPTSKSMSTPRLHLRTYVLWSALYLLLICCRHISKIKKGKEEKRRKVQYVKRLLDLDHELIQYITYPLPI